MRYSELREAKRVYDVRHPYDGSVKFNPNRYIDPNDGFFWHFHEGNLIIHSQEYPAHSASILKTTVPSELWNLLNGSVDFKTHTITIAKEFMAEISFVNDNLRTSKAYSKPCVN